MWTSIQSYSLNMDKYVVVTVSNSKARFFTLEEAEWPEYESGPHLIEQKCISPLEDGCNQNFWSRIVSRSAQKSLLQPDHHYKFERKFAQKITSEIINLVRINQCQRLVLVAQPHILSLVRKSFIPTIFNNIYIQELPKDVSYFNTAQIHAYLAHKNLIPYCQKVSYPR